MRRTSIFALLALSLAVAAAVPAIAADEAPAKPSADATAQAIAALDPAITHVRVFGEWKTDDATGRYRAIIRRADATDVVRFFLQKITDKNDVVSSIELAEIVQNKLTLTGYNFEIDSYGLTLFVETRDNNTGEDVTYEVFFQEDGSYEFQPASN